MGRASPEGTSRTSGVLLVFRPAALSLAATVRSYHVTTFGCQMNEHDSERMKGMLESLGYREAPARGDADLILFNTCSIREKADERFLAHLREANAIKRDSG